MKKNIDSIIENQNAEQKQALFERLKPTLDISDLKPTVASSAKKKSLIASLVVACVLIVCLTITLPIVLKDDGSGDRYCQSSDYTEKQLDCTLKDYSTQNSLPLLNIDWYAVAEDVETYKYVNVNDFNDVIYLSEGILNGETGEMVNLSIVNINTHVKDFEFFHNYCTNEYTVKDVKIYWRVGNQFSLAMFEYQGYRYYIEIDEPNREDLIKKIVAEMLK